QFSAAGTLYHDDPSLGAAEGHAATEALMGDIVHLPEGSMTLQVSLSSSSPTERVDIFNGKELVKTLRPFTADDLGPRIRVLWEGAEYRGRFREVVWDGSAKLVGNGIADARPINFFNRDKVLKQEGVD